MAKQSTKGSFYLYVWRRWSGSSKWSVGSGLGSRRTELSDRGGRPRKFKIRDSGKTKNRPFDEFEERVKKYANARNPWTGKFPNRSRTKRKENCQPLTERKTEANSYSTKRRLACL